MKSEAKQITWDIEDRTTRIDFSNEMHITVNGNTGTLHLDDGKSIEVSRDSKDALETLLMDSCSNVHRNSAGTTTITRYSVRNPEGEQL